MVFEQTIEALFLRALGNRLTLSTRQRLREVGLDVDRKLLPAYAFEVWMRGLEVAAHDLYPTRSMDEAMFELGKCFIEGYSETFLGRAVLGMIRVLGPRRTMLRATQNFRSGNNYTETRITEVSPTCLELWMNEVGDHPTFSAGIIHAALAATGVTPTVELTGYDGHGCTYRCRW